MTDTSPHFSAVDLSALNVVVWSPPNVKMRGVFEMLALDAGRPDMTFNNVSQPDCASHRDFRVTNPVSFIQLSQRNGIIKPSQPNIPTIDNLGPLVQCALASIDRNLIWEHSLTARPDTAWAVTCTRSSGCGCIERRPKDGNIIRVVLGLLV